MTVPRSSLFELCFLGDENTRISAFRRRAQRYDQVNCHIILFYFKGINDIYIYIYHILGSLNRNLKSILILAVNYVRNIFIIACALDRTGAPIFKFSDLIFKFRISFLIIPENFLTNFCKIDIHSL